MLTHAILRTFIFQTFPEGVPQTPSKRMLYNMMTITCCNHVQYKLFELIFLLGFCMPQDPNAPPLNVVPLHFVPILHK